MNIKIADDFKQPLNSMLIIVIEGDSQSIGDKLLGILDDYQKGKPAQGVYIESGSTTQIITPVWDGKKY